MITSKRRTPTTDDLLRRQEGPQKRHKRPHFAQGDEDEDNDVGEDDDFDFEWEAGVEESTDSETGKESSLMEDDAIGRLDESSSLLGSRVVVKPRLVNQRPLSSGAGKPVTFSSLGISPPLLSALSKMAIHAPTEIQQACIPPLLAGQSLWFWATWLSLMMAIFKGRDCMGNAKTGSGKTIAFALPVLQKLSVDPYGIFALVLTPTRYRIFLVIPPKNFLIVIGSLPSRLQNSWWCLVHHSMFELPSLSAEWI
jgi:ATP-dependent RNA helicase DDX49/DBP8